MDKERFKIIVYYDSSCPICSSIKGKIERLDWFNLVHFTTFREEVLDINIAKSILEERMHAKLIYNEEIVTDVDAFSAISVRVPLLLPFYFLLKIGTIFGIGKRVYDYIARRRKIVPVGHCEGHCSINENEK